MARRPQTTRIIKVGDRVRVPFGRELTPATVIELRGPIGSGGRELYRVRLDLPEDEVDSPFELESCCLILILQHLVDAVRFGIRVVDPTEGASLRLGPFDGSGLEVGETAVRLVELVAERVLRA